MFVVFISIIVEVVLKEAARVRIVLTFWKLDLCYVLLVYDINRSIGGPVEASVNLKRRCGGLILSLRHRTDPTKLQFRSI